MNELTYKEKIENNSYMSDKQRRHNDFNIERILECANLGMLNDVSKFPPVNEWEVERIWRHMQAGDEREKLWQYSETTRLEFEHWKRVNSGSPLGIKKAASLAKERKMIKTHNVESAIHYLMEKNVSDRSENSKLYFYSAVYSGNNAIPYGITNSGERRYIFINKYGQNAFQPLVDAVQKNGSDLAKQAKRGTKENWFGTDCKLYGDVYGIEYDVQADGSINPHAHVVFVTDKKINVRKFQRNIQRKIKGSLKLKFNVKPLYVRKKEKYKQPKDAKPVVIDLNKDLGQQSVEMNVIMRMVKYVNKQTLLPILDKPVKSVSGKKVQQRKVIDSLDFYTQLDIYAGIINTLYLKRLTRFGSHGCFHANGIKQLKNDCMELTGLVKVSTNQTNNNLIQSPVGAPIEFGFDSDNLNFNFVKGIPPPDVLSYLRGCFQDRI